MRTVLGAAVLLAFLPTAFAQDKGKTDFSANGEFRLRDVFQQNESGNTSVKPNHDNNVEQRFKLGLKFKVNEKVSVNSTLLQSAMWGQANTETIGDRGTANANSGQTTGDERNFMSVNEAFATWMMSENFNAKFGRMNFGFGDGTVMSPNDFQAQPNSFDGVAMNYETEFGRFTGFIFRYHKYPFATFPSNTSDPTHDAYGLVFDLKTMPDFLKAVNVHVIEDRADGEYGSAAAINRTVNSDGSQNIQRYGAMASFAFGQLDLKANYEMVTGDATATAGGGALTSRTVSQSMYQAELGYNMPNFMSGRAWVKYHQDSGRTQDTTQPDGLQNTDATYDPYFYDRVYGSGLMQLVSWGNLTDISLGLNLKPMDTIEAGVGYHMLSKTSGYDVTNPGTYGGNLTKATVATPSGDSGIGNELDVWASHHYDSGLTMMAWAGYFTPGSWLSGATNNKTADIFQFAVEGKMTF